MQDEAAEASEGGAECLYGGPLLGIEGRPGCAVQLAAAALGEPVPPARAQRYLKAAAVLGDAEVGRLWNAGLGLTTQAAAELALTPPG